MSIHYRTCHLCEAMCGLEIQVTDGQVVRIRGDQQDVHSHGHICPKAVALQDIHNDPDRLRRPLRRTAQGTWEEISWTEALDEAARGMLRIQEQYGRDALGIYTGNPTVHNTGTALYLYDFANAVGTRNRFASHSLDQLPQLFVNGELFGHQAMFPVPDLERTGFFLILGANPLVSNGSIMSTPDIAGRLRAIRQRGGRVVVVDPCFTRTAAAADTHVFIRPGTDILLLLAMVHTLFEEKLIRQSPVSAITDGIDTLQQLVAPYSPEVAAPVTGNAAGDIRRLTRDFAAAEAAVCYGRMGVSTQAYGGLCQWLIYAVNLLTGNLDRPGGMLFPQPAIDFLKLLQKEARALRWTSRVRGLPETAGDLPTATLADEILTPGPGQVRGMVTIAGNPVLSAPNGRRLETALEHLEFMVAIDIYLNETTRHAHLILPPAAGLEVLHYDFVLYLVAPRNSANFSPPVLSKAPGARYDWEILCGLQQRLETSRNGWPARIKHELIRRLTPERRLDLGLRLGPYGVWGGRFGRRDGLSLGRLRQHPHGIDLGPLTPCLPGRLFTPNKRINLTPETITRDLPRVAQLIGEATPLSSPPTGGLLLVGRRHLLSNNSWMHNTPRLMKTGGRCTAWIHPEDAARHGVTEGMPVRVRSETGSVILPAELNENIMPGVVSIPHGWGHDRPGTKLRLAEQYPGVSVNDLTDDRVVDEMTGNAVFNGVPVWIEKEDD